MNIVDPNGVARKTSFHGGSSGRLWHVEKPATGGASGFRSGQRIARMIGLDTNVLARYYVQDQSDATGTR